MPTFKFYFKKHLQGNVTDIKCFIWKIFLNEQNETKTEKYLALILHMNNSERLFITWPWKVF